MNSLGMDEGDVVSVAPGSLAKRRPNRSPLRLTAITVGVAPERIHVELFSGGVSMSPGVVGAARRAAHLPGTTPTPARWCRLRAAGSPPTGSIFLPEHFRVGRSMRRSGPLVVPDRCLS